MKIALAAPGQTSLFLTKFDLPVADFLLDIIQFK